MSRRIDPASGARAHKATVVFCIIAIVVCLSLYLITGWPVLLPVAYGLLAAFLFSFGYLMGRLDG